MSEEKYNKEQIRNRMLKYAAAFWGIKKVENFDPVVKLMLEALANEVYTLGEDFTAIETRLPTYLHQVCWHHHSLRMVLYMLPLLILNT